MEKVKNKMDDVHKVAEKLQLVFPNPMEAMFAVTVILAGMTKAADMDIEIVQTMLGNLYDTLKEDDDKSNLH
jgi:hypothetical protein